jgi:CheY-like chemotaxis protein
MDDKPISVLLVDDDADTRNLFQMVMDHHKFNVEVRRDAEEAIDYLRTNTPDIVVMDIYLPGLDGYQALEKIRRDDLAPTSSFIATTAYYTDDTMRDVLARGFSGYLPKPLAWSSIVPYLEQFVPPNKS